MIEFVFTTNLYQNCQESTPLVESISQKVLLYLHMADITNPINKSIEINIDVSCPYMYLTFFAITAEYHIASNTTSVLIVSLSYVMSNICA